MKKIFCFNRNKNYYHAIAVMIGYIVGIGIFSLPYLTAKAGVGVFLFYIIVLGVMQYFVHLIYANLISITKNFHRLPGYVEKYLGKKGKIAVFIAKIIGNGGALVAYIIIIGVFSHELFSPLLGGSPFIYSSVLFGFCALILFLGIGVIAQIDFYMSFLLILAVLMIVFKGGFHVSPENYILMDWKYLALPYGAMLVALDGNGSLPLVGKLINRKPDDFKRVIRIALSISLIVTIAFTLIVVGITGASTTPDALSGVRSALGNSIMTFVLLFGIISIMTSIVGVTESVRETLCWDFGIGKNVSWFLTMFIPYTLFLLGVNNFIQVVSFIGAIGGGFSAIMLILVFLKIKKDKKKLPIFKKEPKNIFCYLIIFLFTLGMFYEIIHFFS